MEKEMKKLLLVAVSVGVFLLVTITVAIIITAPKVNTQDDVFSSSIPYSHGMPPSHGQPFPDIMNNFPPQPDTTISITNGINNISDSAAITDINNGDSLTIQIPMPPSTAIPDNTTSMEVTIAPTVRPADPAANQSTTQVRPAAAAQPAAPRPAAASVRTTTTTTSVRPAASRAVNDYWVQTGAFTSMVRAEDAKEMLSTKGLTSIIETRIVNGQNFYRVRLGPYTSENEAKHWLDIVKLIDGFSESQVRQTTR
ncbi:MAG: SPOR domain-containing protein [Treponema sp.]|nr:SPOR domain-containing protein [Treponema sp.]